MGQRAIKQNRWGKPESSHSDDGIWFVWGDDTGKFEVWDMRDLKLPPRTVKAHQGPIVGITISADGSASGDFIVTVSEENVIKVWELPKKAEPAKKTRPKK